MTKDEVVKILNDNSQKSVIGWAIEEDDFNEVAEKIVKLCNLQNVNGSILAKADMINALTNTLEVNKKVLGEYHIIRDKSIEKLKALLDSV